MVLDNLPSNNGQARPPFSLDNLLSLGDDLNGRLQYFLVVCQGNKFSPKTIKNYREKLGAFVKVCKGIGVTLPAQVGAVHIRLFLLQKQDSCCGTSLDDYYRAIKRFFNWMVEEGLLKDSPMKAIKHPKKEQTIIKPFTAEQIQILFSICDQGTFLGIRNKAIMVVLLDTGLRLNELANVLLSDVDIENRTIRTLGKGAKERRVAFGSKTLRMLLQYLVKRKEHFPENKLPYLWLTEEGKRLEAIGIQIMIHRLGVRIGIKDVRCSPHTFRHSFATMFLVNSGARERPEAGASELQTLLGHSSNKMTRRYTATVLGETAINAHRHFSPVDNLLTT